MTKSKEDPARFVRSITSSDLTIYDPIEIGHPNLWIPLPVLQVLLDSKLRGESLAGLKNRTRSKVAKELICRILGYPVPKSFKKTQPRFPGQIFDTYVQKSNNLQIWNEDLSPTRRYVIIRVSDAGYIDCVRVVNGDTLASLDTTGTLTQKYQARCIPGGDDNELIDDTDTSNLSPMVSSDATLKAKSTPICQPIVGEILPISIIFNLLRGLIQTTFPDPGCDQERNRGAALHALVCKALGYAKYQDDGQFPDIRHQLLEVKLQTSSTIDLGLVTPDSTEALDIIKMDGCTVCHSDIRYAIFYANTDGTEVIITHLFLTTGESFFTRFPRFEGNVVNKKIQIRLPGDFFDL